MERKRKVKRKAVISIALGMVIIFTMAACKAGEETEKDTGTKPFGGLGYGIGIHRALSTGQNSHL